MIGVATNVTVRPSNLIHQPTNLMAYQSSMIHQLTNLIFAATGEIAL